MARVLLAALSLAWAALGCILGGGGGGDADVTATFGAEEFRIQLTAISEPKE
jgi:hypothetical protein